MLQKTENAEEIANPPEHKKEFSTKDHMELATKAEEQGDWKTAAKFYSLSLEERAVELALINSVQDGLSANYEMQAIYDLVGDKLRDTFNAQVVMISQYDPQSCIWLPNAMR